MTDVLKHLDQWIEDDGNIAAITARQWLESVEGPDAVIFPPTYPDSGSGYQIDRFNDGTSICQIDSAGSQANRLEPIFKKPPYRTLVPQTIIEAEDQQLDILDAGHRAADAIVRFSDTFGSEAFQAFTSLKENGDAEKMARLAPTTIVFGGWDSRATQAKLPRIVRSVIRAYDIKEIHRSAQYSTIAGTILKGEDTETDEKSPNAKLGFSHHPLVNTHGGVIATGGIRRDATINITPIRALGSTSGEKEDDLSLRRYILGLCLVVFTAPQETSLREGCMLVPAEDRPAEWKQVYHDGTREIFNVTHQQALEFAQGAAEAFGLKQELRTVKFNKEIANQFRAMKENDRKAKLKQDPATWQENSALAQPAPKKRSPRK